MNDLIVVFQNYIWVPIVSAIIGTVLGWGGPKVIKYFQVRKEKRINENIQEFSIEGDWNSFFCEEKNLRTEMVHLYQLGRDITGTMEMKMDENEDDRVYNFSGHFKNQILVGTYESENNRKDERGTIVLRYINDKMLSGYCTFIYKNKQVYNSPYVLTLASEHKVDKGTYQFCNSCIGKFDCCCNCEKIDMPILLPFEVEKIRRITKKGIDSFCVKLTNNLYQMKRKNDDEEKECYFFDNNKCSIYEDRPIDCRMFPFDFKEINGEYWVIYYNKVCQAIPSKKEEIDMCAHNMRPLLDIVLPYMSECSNPVFSKRLSEQEYTELVPINKIIDDNNF